MSMYLGAAVWKFNAANPTALESGELIVLLCLADQVRKGQNSCWPAVETVAKATHQGESTVRRIIGQLERKGLLDCTRANGKSTKYEFSPEITQHAPRGEKEAMPSHFERGLKSRGPEQNPSQIEQNPSQIEQNPSQIGPRTYNKPIYNLSPAPLAQPAETAEQAVAAIIEQMAPHEASKVLAGAEIDVRCELVVIRAPDSAFSAKLERRLEEGEFRSALRAAGIGKGNWRFDQRSTSHIPIPPTQPAATGGLAHG